MPEFMFASSWKAGKLKKDEIGDFWVVTERMGKNSTLNDIVFRSDTKDMMFQALGGLSPRQIIGIYKTAKKARNEGRKILKKVI